MTVASPLREDATSLAAGENVTGHHEQRSSLAPWFIVGLLFLATLLNYLDRQTISVLATRIAEDPSMRLTDANLGQIFFAFLLAYGLAQLAVGPLLDRLTVKVAYPLAVGAWSLAGAAAAISGGFWSLFGLRMLLGVCESPNWPLALRVVSRAIPPRQRSLASGVFQCGTSVGALIAPPAIIWLTLNRGWRFAFIAVGAVGLVWVLLWITFLATTYSSVLSERAFQSKNSTDKQLNESASFRTAAMAICRSRAFWGLFIATSFLNPLQYFYTTWLPRYFEKYANVPFGTALAQRLVIVYLALDAGLLIGGATVFWLVPKLGLLPARRFVATIGATCMAVVPSVAWASNLTVVTAIVCTATFGLGAFMVNYLACTSEVSKSHVSTAAGLLGGTGSLTGAAFMWLVGDLVTRNGSFGAAFLLAGAMPLIALAGFWFATSPVALDAAGD